MKAVYNKSFVQVFKNSLDTSYIFITDIPNLSYCLSRELFDDDLDFCNRVFVILKKQKSSRAVVQKFNSICKSLDL